MTRVEHERLRRLVLEETRPIRPPLTPELRIYGADDFTNLWSATETRLETLHLAPPFWAFAWPGGQALARHLLDHPDLAADATVVAIGAGGALEAIAAARVGAARVVANDLDPAAGAAARLNAELNEVALEICDADLTLTPAAGPLDPRAADLVLVGDAFYERATAERLERLLRAAATAGARVLIGDPGRGFPPKTRMVEAARHAVPTPVALEDRTVVETVVWRLDPMV